MCVALACKVLRPSCVLCLKQKKPWLCRRYKPYFCTATITSQQGHAQKEQHRTGAAPRPPIRGIAHCPLLGSHPDAPEQPPTGAHSLSCAPRTDPCCLTRCWVLAHHRTRAPAHAHSPNPQAPALSTARKWGGPRGCRPRRARSSLSSDSHSPLQPNYSVCVVGHPPPAAREA